VSSTESAQDAPVEPEPVHEARADENVTLDWKYLRASHLQLTVGLRSESPGPGAYDRDPSLQQEAATGAFAVPYGYDLRQTAEYNRVQAWYDSRHPWPESGSGVRIEAKAEQGSDMIARSGWIRYGTTVTGSVDLDQHQHVISLVAAVELADPLGERPVPFTELVALGGDGPMRGTCHAGCWIGAPPSRHCTTCGPSLPGSVATSSWLQGTCSASTWWGFARICCAFRATSASPRWA